MRTRSTFLVVVASVLLAITAGPRSHAARSVVDVTTCGQVVLGPGRAQLIGDLDCSAFPGVALWLTGRNARLFLNGFTLTGTKLDVDLRATMYCGGRCSIVGPGVINGGELGVIAVRSALVPNVLVPRVRVLDVTVVVAGAGIVAGSQNGVAIVKRSTITGGATGVVAYRRAVIVDSVITGNQIYGVSALDGRVVLRRSTVLGNGLDVASESRPAIRGNSTCGTSVQPSTGLTWGVCDDD